MNDYDDDDDDDGGGRWDADDDQESGRSDWWLYNQKMFSFFTNANITMCPLH